MSFSVLVKNLAKLPVASIRLKQNLQKLSRYHNIIEDRNARVAPQVLQTFDRYRSWRIFHPGPIWVDKDLPLTRREYSEYVWLLRDVQRLAPFATPFLVGPLGFIAIASCLSNPHWAPTAFLDETDFEKQKLDYYEQYLDDHRLKYGPLLQHHIARLYRHEEGMEHSFFYHESVESYKEIFYSHVTGKVRDYRKLFGLNFHELIPNKWLLLTNRDPVEVTPELLGDVEVLKEKNLPREQEVKEFNEILRKHFKIQELSGGPKTNIDYHTRLIEDEYLLGENAKFPGEQIPPEDQVPFEQMEYTGDKIFVAYEKRTGADIEKRHMALFKNQFLGLPWRFAPTAWLQRRWVTWYEQCLHEDALIEREGGVGKLSDTELKLALLDRAVLRFDEDLTRGDMEARYKEISGLMSMRAPSVLITAWQTAYYRTTYSPEDDLPQPSILPKFNRSVIDVDHYNVLNFEKVDRPEPKVNPALYPNAHRYIFTNKPSLHPWDL